MKDMITCISCRNELRRNTAEAEFDCYCPICGERMRISGDEVFFYKDWFSDHTPRKESPMDRIRSLAESGDWISAHDAGLAVRARLPHREGLLLMAEINYHMFREFPELSRAYLFVKVSSLNTAPVFETCGAYGRDLETFNGLAGVSEFDAGEVTELIARCKPADERYDCFASRFCSSALFLHRQAKKMGMKRDKRRARRDIFDYAAANGLDIMSGVARAYLDSLT